MPNHPNHKWRKTELVFPDTVLQQDDWTLLDQAGDRIAHLFNTCTDDLIGAWRWRAWLDHKMQEGSAAAQRRERLLAEYQQGQMVHQ
jgi:hypothetical protein